MSEPRAQLLGELQKLFGDLAGQDLSGAPGDATFFDLGFDSLFLTQASQAVRKRFGVKITFRQMLEDLTTLDAMAAYLAEKVPANAAPATTPAPTITAAKSAAVPAPVATPQASTSANPLLEEIIGRQQRILEQQLALLRGTPPPAAPPAKASAPHIISTPAAAPTAAPAKPFGPYRPVDKSAGSGFTERQQQHLDELIARYIRKSPGSKKRTQENRRNFSDPRSVSGFRPFWKEMVYPIITTRSAGARFWDVDGNEYIDLTMGFGTNLLGHAPAFITEAIEKQLKLGIEVGPQSPLAGEVAQLLCELTGHERAAFCNTGSEAVLAAVRIARTVTGRTRLATTSGFHGINDEVLVRANVVKGERRSVPVAPGIPEHIVRDVLVLDYGSEESLELLKQQADDLAAILIEPVQSRHPDLQPRAFLHEVRRITERSETALIFDEVINGFRCHLNGAQAHFGVKSDIGTWGKIIGGGLPIGAVTGSAQYMDALDGGYWQFGDTSFPEVGVTFFAGTYVRHPLAMAASRAILRYLKEQGPGLQQHLNERTTAFVTRLNTFLQAQGAPLHVEHFSSLFYIHFEADVKYGSLLYFHLREKGLHIWEGRPCFLSTAHTDEDVEEVIRIFQESIVEMQRGGFLPEPPAEAEKIEIRAPQPRLEIIAPTAPLAPAAAAKAVQFSLYFFGHYPPEYDKEKYQLIIDSAKYADAHGFTAIWLPERHFHAHGGFSPNPSVLAAALARETQQLQLRGGSVVLPLHHPVRVAEEWSVVDNLSNGRTGISIASGWHPNDFVFAPEAFEKRREICHEHLVTIQRLWRGETLRFPTGGQKELDVKLHPLPKQPELPVWLTCIHKESFIKAGELGVGVLGYLMNQTVADAAEKIALYREALVRHGHDPARGHVTILLHTFVGADLPSARAVARGPLREYLRTFLDNSQKRIETQGGEVEMDAEDMDYLLDRAFEDYVQGKALIGSPESCAGIVAELQAIGVDEIGCFVDFGISAGTVLEHMKDLAELKRRCDATAPNAVPSDGPRMLPLSGAQSGLWAISQFGGDAARAYNESTTLKLRGPLDQAALHSALQQLVDRHEALRTTFDNRGEMQTIHPHLDLEIARADFSALDAAARPEALRKCFDDFEATAFDLTRGPIFKALVITLGAEEHLLVLLFHHLLGNGPSYWVFFEELVALYEAARAQKPALLEPPLQLSDFLRWRSARTDGEEDREDEAFWHEQFTGTLPALDLPADHPRPALRTYHGGRRAITIDETLTRRLRETGARQRSSLFMLLFAAYKTWLFRLTNQQDIVVGVPAESGVRELPGGTRLFANTTNMLPLRTRLDGNTPFADLLAQTRTQILTASEHQEYFFGRLLPQINFKADPSRSALFAVTFNYETGKFTREASGTHFEFVTDQVPYRNARGVSPFELVANIAENDGVLLMECDFNADLYDAETVERWLGYYRRILESIALDPTQTLDHFPLLNETERQRVLAWGHGAATPYPADLTVHAKFEQRAVETPDAIALIDGEHRLTYAELDARANQYASYLRKKGFGEGAFIGLSGHRYWQFGAGVLGILKIGAAYVPLDPQDPPARLATLRQHLDGMLEDKLDVSAEPATPGPAAGQPTGAAYVMFTSGSTGEPKGVMVSHRGVTRLVCETDYAPFDRKTVMMQGSNLCFDASTLEIWGALLQGGTLVFTRFSTLIDHVALAEFITQQGINTLFLTTSLFNQHVRQAPAMFAGLRCVVFGGEAADPSMINRVLEQGRPQQLVNGYGPTETTTFAVCHQIKGAAETVPIGRPIANTEIFILDEQGQPVPPDVTGEIYIGGPGVALGYLRRPELTAERFLETEFGRLYRTGDYGRWLSDGTIDYQGRIDQQFKLRGFRIEPAEIEALLRLHPAVAQCAVLAKTCPSGETVPIAYLVRKPEHETVSDTDFRKYLSENLPLPLLPYQWFWLDALPLTANGKLDHRALPEPTAETQSARQVVPPQNSVHAHLIEIWEEVINRRPIGIRDNFFDLGGHSLHAAKIVALIFERLGQRLSFGEFFNNPTIEQHAQSLLGGPRHVPNTHAVVINPEGKKTPVFFFHGDFVGGGFFCKTLASVIGTDRPFYALHPHGLQGDAVPLTIEAMAADRVKWMREVQPHGPYILGGYCNGSFTAFHAARLLRAAGEEVSVLLMLNSDGSNVRFGWLKKLTGVTCAMRGEDEAAALQRFLHTRRRLRDREDISLYYLRAAADLLKHPSREKAAPFLRKAGRLIGLKAANPSANGHHPPDIVTAVPRGPLSKPYADACRTFIPGRYDSRVVLLWPREEKPRNARGPAEGWEKICAHYQVVEVPGHHHSCISQNTNVVLVGEAMKKAIAQVENSVSSLPS